MVPVVFCTYFDLVVRHGIAGTRPIETLLTQRFVNRPDLLGKYDTLPAAKPEDIYQNVLNNYRYLRTFGAKVYLRVRLSFVESHYTDNNPVSTQAVTRIGDALDDDTIPLLIEACYRMWENIAQHESIPF